MSETGAAAGHGLRQRLGSALTAFASQLNSARSRRLGLLAGSRAVMAVAGFVAVVLITRHLSPAEVGAWSIILALQGYALQIGEFGLRTVTTAEAGRPGQSPMALMPAYLAARLPATAVMFVGACALASIWWPQWLLPVAVVMLSLFSLALFIDWVCLVEDRPVRAAGLLLVRPAVMLTGLLILGETLSLLALSLLFTLSWSVAAALSWMAAPAASSHAEPGRPIGPWRLLELGRSIMGSQLLGQMMINLDLVVVGAVLGLAAAGQYFLASSIGIACLVVANAAGQIAVARLGRSVEERAVFEREVAREASYLGWIATCFIITLSLSADAIVNGFFGPGYSLSASLLLVMLPWLWLAHQTALLQAALAVRRETRSLFRIALYAAAIMGAGLAGAAFLKAAFAFAAVRSAVEAARFVLLLRHLPVTLRRRVTASLVLPAAISLVVIVAALLA